MGVEIQLLEMLRIKNLTEVMNERQMTYPLKSTKEK